MSKKPSVNTSPVASNYTAPDERIIEVSHETGGCLVSLRPRDGRLRVEVYRADDTVDVISGGKCRCDSSDETPGQAYVVETREIGGVEHRVYLLPDSYADSPREADCLVGVTVARSHRYAWPEEDADSVGAADVARAVDDFPFEVVARWLRVFHGASAVLPLYTAGEDTLSAGNASDRPTAGNYVGVTFDCPRTREVTGVPADQIAAALVEEIREFSRWATGETYGYVIERRSPCGCGWVDVASLWGLVGDEYAERSAREALDELTGD